MILRKPYAFLIKHFKLIHIILSVFTIYSFTKFYNIYKFFNEYVKNNYTISSYAGLSSDIISFIFYLVIFLTLVILILVVLLFKNKNKPSKFYELSTVYYLIAFVLLFVTSGILFSFETSIIDAQVARIYRDVSLIFMIPQLPIIIVLLIRSLGFNIKKFDFESDIKDLEISDADNEEFEISINYEPYKIKRTIRRFLREFKYYLKENVFIFIAICITLLLIAAYLIYSGITKDYNNNYRQGNTFIYQNLSLKFEDSIITNLNYRGDKIDNYYYLVIKLNISNDTESDIDFNIDNIRLSVNNKTIAPIRDKNNNFIDYAETNNLKKIVRKTNNTYMLVYQLNENEIKNSYTINIYKGSIREKEDIIDTYNYIKITPVVIDEVENATNAKIGDKVDFSNSNLLETTVTVDKYELTNQYVYDYQSCITETDCRTYKGYVNISHTDNKKILLVLDLSYKIDKNSVFSLKSKKASTFIETFAKLRYKNISGEYVYSNIKNVTPDRLNNTIVVEVDNKVEASDELYLSLTIRNKEYLIKLK